MVLRKKSILLIMVFLIGGFVCACGKEDSVAGESLVEDTEEVSSTEETKKILRKRLQYNGKRATIFR
mgnify:CR=1 FL=1